MNVLLFLNGKVGSQAGIEYGFKRLYRKGKISSLGTFYYQSAYRACDNYRYESEMLSHVMEFSPDVIVIFHIGVYKISREFFSRIRNICPRVKIVYDEGDMYGGLAKRPSNSMCRAMTYSDCVSIRGLGSWYDYVQKLNSNIIYTPHSNSLAHLQHQMKPMKNRSRNIVFIGNRITSRIGPLRRVPGAGEREKFVKKLKLQFYDKMFVYGAGWSKLIDGARSLPFDKQLEVCSRHWIHVAHEHYPSIPFYFSDRLPIALSAGQIYVCKYHPGYEQLFKGADFIYFANNARQAGETIRYLFSLSDDVLEGKAKRAQRWADQNLSPEVVWGNMLSQVVV